MLRRHVAEHGPLNDQGKPNPVVQEHSIWQTGQEVVLSRMGHPQSHVMGRAHVAEHDHRSRNPPFTVVDG